ncbi:MULTISPECIES: hypothetical protein [Vibrio]|jgi:hypothetical protein|uniref:hypothetical protein n=1 Tax=Vibrio TaxID=662 RepID=UPI000AD860AD|nr:MULTISPECIES: hypothetical protein [Vibrio]MCF7361150.1 hypothetical protein [Vibrio sp. A1-b2]
MEQNLIRLYRRKQTLIPARFIPYFSPLWLEKNASRLSATNAHSGENPSINAQRLEVIIGDHNNSYLSVFLRFHFPLIQ